MGIYLGVGLRIAVDLSELVVFFLLGGEGGWMMNRKRARIGW